MANKKAIEQLKDELREELSEDLQALRKDFEEMNDRNKNFADRLETFKKKVGESFKQEDIAANKLEARIELRLEAIEDALKELQEQERPARDDAPFELGSKKLGYNKKEWTLEKVITTMIARKAKNLNSNQQRATDQPETIRLGRGRELLALCLHCFKAGEDPDKCIHFGQHGCARHRTNKHRPCFCPLKPTGEIKCIVSKNTNYKRTQTLPDYSYKEQHEDKIDWVAIPLPGFHKDLQFVAKLKETRETRSGLNPEWSCAATEEYLRPHPAFAPKGEFHDFLETHINKYRCAKDVEEDIMEEEVALQDHLDAVEEEGGASEDEDGLPIDKEVMQEAMQGTSRKEEAVSRYRAMMRERCVAEEELRLLNEQSAEADRRLNARVASELGEGAEVNMHTASAELLRLQSQALDIRWNVSEADDRLTDLRRGSSGSSASTARRTGVPKRQREKGTSSSSSSSSSVGAVAREDVEEEEEGQVLEEEAEVQSATPVPTPQSKKTKAKKSKK